MVANGYRRVDAFDSKQQHGDDAHSYNAAAMLVGLRELLSQGSTDLSAVMTCDLASQLALDAAPAERQRRHRFICTRCLNVADSVCRRERPDRLEWRMLRKTPLVLVVVDRQRALFGSTPGGPAVITDVEESVRLGITVFETLWNNAVPASLFADLDERRRAVLDCLADGMTDGAAASRLNICERTVRREVNRLMRSAGVTSRFQLGQRAQQMGWVANTAERPNRPATTVISGHVS